MAYLIHRTVDCCLTSSVPLPGRAVPCFKRATEMERGADAGELALGGDEEGWVATHSGDASGGAAGGSGSQLAPAVDDTPDIDDVGETSGGAGGGAGTAGGDDDSDVPDIEELDLEDDEVGAVSNPGQVPAHCSSRA